MTKTIRALAALALVSTSLAAIHPPLPQRSSACPSPIYHAQLTQSSVHDASPAPLAGTLVKSGPSPLSTSGKPGKDPPPPQITVRLLGGQAGNFTSTVSGVPRFAPSEELILFLERTSAQDFSIVSWMQGTFRIGRSRTTGEEIVTQDTAAFPVFDPLSHNFETTGIRKMPVSAFRTLVIASAEAQAVQGSRQ